ncbi:DUF1524 domain-containing protein [Sporichthya sp.]|uniref:GmrSD restriction endonuclease domain-containing protein n=1 Tax=Sporichthya sp. TaxID=65475 RepID=UPI0025F9CD79|nr:DUF1524 domain-containing protein [Sporichthya sp.]
MTRRRPTLAALALAGAVFALGACGSDSGSVTGAAPAPPTAIATPERTLDVTEVEPSATSASDVESTATAVPTDDEPSADDTAAPAPTALEPTSSAAPGSGTARALLATLAVKGRAAQTGYEREEYGQAWADVDRNGCDTRNDILRRDLRSLVFKPGTRDCVVASGLLEPEPYTGARIDFLRGETTSTAVQIDHVVALADSWVSGALGWDERKRIAFGNDPLNLLAVDGPANSQKGAGDAATWLPRSSYRCTYIARQIAVKAKYELWVKPAERDAMSRILDTCPGEKAPSYGPVELPPPGLGSAAPAAPVETPKPAAGTDPRFPYCTDAKKAGYGPYVEGEDPEYGWYRDADSDGIVCE